MSTIEAVDTGVRHDSRVDHPEEHVRHDMPPHEDGFSLLAPDPLAATQAVKDLNVLSDIDSQDGSEDDSEYDSDDGSTVYSEEVEEEELRVPLHPPRQEHPSEGLGSTTQRHGSFNPPFQD